MPNTIKDIATHIASSCAASFDTASQKRELIDRFFKRLHSLRHKIVNKLVDASIAQIVKHFEQSKVNTPGVYQYSGSTFDGFTRCTNPTEINIDTKKPVLLFIHGTISSSEHGFSDLWNHSEKGYMKRLLKPYGQQIFFLEHYTISTSPIENALDTAKVFPKNTCFHIISHSRGGLVGELLCQSNLKRRTKKSRGKFVKSNTIFSEQELKYFREEPKRKADYEGLKQLQQIFLDRQFTVERFIRVAAPMHGTAMASISIDEVVTTVFDALHAIPIPRILGVRNFLKSVAFTFIKKARSVEMLPGIESMMPTSPLITLLNRESVQLQDELTVMAGEITNAAFITDLKNKWLTHNIFKESHDFVVNTSATFGGCKRPHGYSRYHLRKSHNVGHFNYFQHKSILQKIEDALTKPLGTIGAFKPIISRNKNSTKAIISTRGSHFPVFLIKKKTQTTQLTNWIKKLLHDREKTFFSPRRLKVKASGLVSNIHNQLFYIPIEEDW